jgi:hypothetical protein
MQNKNNERFCEPFNMTPKQFQAYKDSKQTRWLWYVFWMALGTIFNDRVYIYIIATFWLIGSYWHNAKCEEQWIKDGSLQRREDAKNK